MSARFRIRTSQGQEISFASREMFAEFVRSGEMSDDDVVYDAAAREWSSALTHPVVLEICREAEEARAPEGEDAGGEQEEASEAGSEDGSGEEDGHLGSTPPSGLDIGLDLAPAPDEPSPEEQAAAFVKRMEAERAGDLDFVEEDRAVQGLQREHGSSGLVGGFHLGGTSPPKHPSQSRRARQGDHARPVAPTGAGPSRPEPPVGQSARDGSLRATKPRPKVPRKRRGYVPVLLVAVATVLVVVAAAPDLFGPPEGDDASGAGTDSVTLPPPPSLIPDTEESLRERATERYLTATRALLGDLPPIPDSWLSGAYLAAPSDYPQVREAWNQYLTTVRQLRQGDADRYRVAYRGAMDDAGVASTARTLRLANAVSAFQDDGLAREEHYGHVEALASAALRGHDALVEAEGTIAYEPAATTPISGDPIIEAVGRSPEAQALLDQVLDMILLEMSGPGGPGQAAVVREWVWDGLLDAVAG